MRFYLFIYFHFHLQSQTLNKLYVNNSTDHIPRLCIPEHYESNAKMPSAILRVSLDVNMGTHIAITTGDIEITYVPQIAENALAFLTRRSKAAWWNLLRVLSASPIGEWQRKQQEQMVFIVLQTDTLEVYGLIGSVHVYLIPPISPQNTSIAPSVLIQTKSIEILTNTDLWNTTEDSGEFTSPKHLRRSSSTNSSLLFKSADQLITHTSIRKHSHSQFRKSMDEQVPQFDPHNEYILDSSDGRVLSGSFLSSIGMYSVGQTVSLFMPCVIDIKISEFRIDLEYEYDASPRTCSVIEQIDLGTRFAVQLNGGNSRLDAFPVRFAVAAGCSGALSITISESFFCHHLPQWMIHTDCMLELMPTGAPIPINTAVLPYILVSPVLHSCLLAIPSIHIKVDCDSQGAAILNSFTMDINSMVAFTAVDLCPATTNRINSNLNKQLPSLAYAFVVSGISLSVQEAKCTDKAHALLRENPKQMLVMNNEENVPNVTTLLQIDSWFPVAKNQSQEQLQCPERQSRSCWHSCPAIQQLFPQTGTLIHSRWYFINTMITSTFFQPGEFYQSSTTTNHILPPFAPVSINGQIPAILFGVEGKSDTNGLCMSSELHANLALGNVYVFCPMQMAENFARWGISVTKPNEQMPIFDPTTTKEIDHREGCDGIQQETMPPFTQQKNKSRDLFFSWSVNMNCSVAFIMPLFTLKICESTQKTPKSPIVSSQVEDLVDLVAIQVSNINGNYQCVSNFQKQKIKQSQPQIWIFRNIPKWKFQLNNENICIWHEVSNIRRAIIQFEESDKLGMIFFSS